MKVTRFTTDFDPGSDTPAGAMGAGTIIAAGDLSGTHAVPKVSGIGGVTISGTPTAGETLIASSGTAAAWGANTPGGSAGGDLAGTYPNPSVAKINTSPLGTTTGASSGDVLTWNGSAWTHSTPLSGSITVTDGSTSLSATEIDFTSGAVVSNLGSGIAGVAISGGGGSGLPTLIQSKSAGTSATSIVMGAAPTSGNVLALVTNSTTGQVSAVTQTNVTWTQMLTLTSGGGSFYAIWIGKVSASASATINMTKPGGFNTAYVIELSAVTVTPTLGQSVTFATPTQSPITATVVLPATTSGHLIILAGGHDNTAHWQALVPSIPTVGLLAGIDEIVAGFSQGGTVTCNALPDTSISGTTTAILIAEIT